MTFAFPDIIKYCSESFLVAAWYFTVCLCHNLTNTFPFVGYLGCFEYLAIKNSVVFLIMSFGQTPKRKPRHFKALVKI